MMDTCPECGSDKIEKEETDQTEDGAEIYSCKCLKCGHEWQEEG
jgi:DNA-directed RNA polymerase subunit M/transcription elongation factor TFIIS